MFDSIDRLRLIERMNLLSFAKYDQQGKIRSLLNGDGHVIITLSSSNRINFLVSRTTQDEMQCIYIG